MTKIKKEEFYSIPNCMGYFRILLIPVFCVLYLNADTWRDYYLAAGVILVSTITDFLDGQVARRFHMITELGKFLDPLADKLTHGAVAVCLAFRYETMRYLFALMLVKEGFFWDYKRISKVMAVRCGEDEPWAEEYFRLFSCLLQEKGKGRREAERSEKDA